MTVEWNWGLIRTSYCILFIASSTTAKMHVLCYWNETKQNEMKQKKYAYGCIQYEHTVWHINQHTQTRPFFFNQLCDRISIAPWNCFAREQAKKWREQKGWASARECEWVCTQMKNDNRNNKWKFVFCGNSVSQSILVRCELRKWNKQNSKILAP